ncbi:hypothetical protein J1N35_016326 [Gossypium stocksii]|uniref:RIN4 pathogenic type III effector avirulence factor Avr cleavage site domain-containing protein n=1 Tax=Gossypium stocksii TaxID=47602 RepID=A0A9D3VKD5_9ROSI|nr:hypothetical protein J1N35_016326 [Gossypium stocksii]
MAFGMARETMRNVWRAMFLVFRTCNYSSFEKGRALPKFGEWDVNNPAAAEGFTVIFNKARDEKKTKGSAPNIMPSASSKKNQPPPSPPTPKSKWFCCVGV